MPSSCLITVYIFFLNPQTRARAHLHMNTYIHTPTHTSKVWLSFAQFELSVGEEDSVQRVREVYRQAHERMKQAEEDLKEERVAILHAWKLFEVRAVGVVVVLKVYVVITGG